MVKIMNKQLIRLLVISFLLTILVSTACRKENAPEIVFENSDIVISSPYIIEGAGSISAAYLHINNKSSVSEKLISVNSNLGTAMLHQTIIKNGIVRMQHLTDGIEISPGSHLHLEPGSFHVMLNNLQRNLVSGEKIELILEFQNIGRIAIEVPVIKSTERGDHSH